jgi:hypothetical protein
VNRVINEVRPYLIEFAAVSHDMRKRAVEGALDGRVF